MQIIRYEDPLQYDVVWPISDTDRQDEAFAEAERRVNELFKELGAKVVYGVADAGEPASPPRPIIPDQPSETMAAFHGRPA